MERTDTLVRSAPIAIPSRRVSPFSSPHSSPAARHRRSQRLQQLVERRRAGADSPARLVTDESIAPPVLTRSRKHHQAVRSPSSSSSSFSSGWSDEAAAAVAAAASDAVKQEIERQLGVTQQGAESPKDLASLASKAIELAAAEVDRRLSEAGDTSSENDEEEKKERAEEREKAKKAACGLCGGFAVWIVDKVSAKMAKAFGGLFVTACTAGVLLMR